MHSGDVGFCIMLNSEFLWFMIWHNFLCIGRKQCRVSFLFFNFLFLLVLPVYCYQPISLHPREHILSHVIPWTSARQTPLSVDFSRQEYWSGLPFPSPRVSFLNSFLTVLIWMEAIWKHYVLTNFCQKSTTDRTWAQFSLLQSPLLSSTSASNEWFYWSLSTYIPSLLYNLNPEYLGSEMTVKIKLIRIHEYFAVSN